MYKFTIAIMLIAACLAMPLMAQDKDATKDDMAAMMTAPAPLDDDFMQWMVGEWEGWSESSMGKSKDWVKYEMGLDGQFLLIHYKSQMGEISYTGMGAITKDAETGDAIGLWIDNFRSMSNGKGKREGDTMTMNWSGKMGSGTRITQKVSADKFVVTESWTMPDGSVMESKSELTRIKKVTEK
ncbi:MAG: DUF1579 family protein [bacterium]